ncbi:ADP-ribose 1''-phosphate phosphatase [Orbilia javanica]|uniref:ADP-ribose 1''-phosphate phosphatase n=1 Tax=Orbilia javanica TaxID=47235 RepID=A0AAN8NA58_9PEZI
MSGLSENEDLASGPRDNIRETLGLGERLSPGVVMIHGDIFAAPENSVLIHACNCQGSWGAGIAFAFKQRYPEAYAVYHSHCTSVSNRASLVGTALLIPPQPNDAKGHWIGCLFTSQHYGRRVDTPDNILLNTISSFEHLLNLVGNEETGGTRTIGELHACKINSGRFGVDWDLTKEILEDGLDEDGKGRGLYVYHFDEFVPRATHRGGGVRGGRGGYDGRGGGGGRGGGRGGQGGGLGAGSGLRERTGLSFGTSVLSLRGLGSTR